MRQRQRDIKIRDRIAVLRKNGYPKDLPGVYDRSRGSRRQRFIYLQRYKGHALRGGPFADADLAFQVLNAERNKIDAGIYRIVTRSTKTLKEKIEELERRNVFGSWSRTKLSHLQTFKNLYNGKYREGIGNVQLMTLDADVIRHFISQAKKHTTIQGHITDNKTIQNKLFTLSDVLCLIKKDGDLTENIVAQMLLDSDIKKELKQYENEGWQKFNYVENWKRDAVAEASRDYPDPRAERWITMMVVLGLRTSDLLSLHWQDNGENNYIDLPKQRLHYRYHKSDAICFADGRNVILNTKLLRFLSEQPDQEGLFIKPEMTSDSCLNQLQRVIETMENPEQYRGIRPRDIRKSVSTDLINRAIQRGKTKAETTNYMSLTASNLGHTPATGMRYYNAIVDTRADEARAFLDGTEEQNDD